MLISSNIRIFRAGMSNSTAIQETLRLFIVFDATRGVGGQWSLPPLLSEQTVPRPLQDCWEGNSFMKDFTGKN